MPSYLASAKDSVLLRARAHVLEPICRNMPIHPFMSSLASNGNIYDALILLRGVSSNSAQTTVIPLSLLLGACYPSPRVAASLASDVRGFLLGLSTRGAFAQSLESYLDRNGNLIATDEFMLDVTSTSRDPNRSGIPRVVRNYASSGRFASVAWSRNSRLSPVSYVGDEFLFSPEHWRPSRLPTRAIHALLVALGRLLKFRLVTRKPGLLSALRSSLGDAYRLLLILTSPTARTCLVPHSSAQLLEAEIPSTDVSRSIKTLKDADLLAGLSLFIHDTLPITHPHFFPDHEKARFVDLLPLLNAADNILVASEHVYECLTPLINHPDRIHVIGLPTFTVDGGWPDSGVESDVSAEDAYVLVMGGADERKNVDWVLDIAGFVAQSASSPVHLKSVIGSVRQNESLAKSLHRCRAAGARVDVVLRPTDAELALLISNALAVVYCSAAEGYGLPIPEALALGIPVIATDIPPHREFASLGSCTFVSLFNDLDLAAALESTFRRTGVSVSRMSSSSSGQSLVDTPTWISEQFALLFPDDPTTVPANSGST